MEEVERLLTKAVEELERILSSKTVVGEPIVVGEATMIPLVSVGFGFGAGGGSGTQPGQAGQGYGGGTGGGGGIKPVAILIVDQQGVRLEPVTSGKVGLMEKIGALIASGIQKGKEGKEQSK